MFELATKTLRDAFGLASKYANPRSTLPVLQTVKLSTEMDGSLTLRATNLEAGIILRIPEIPVTVAGELLIPAATFNQVLSTWGDRFAAKLNARTGILTINGSGSAKADVKCWMNVDEFPPVTGLSTGAQATALIRMPGKTFADAVRRVAGFASTDDARPVLTGVHFYYDHEKQALRLEAADGFRLAVETIPVETAIDKTLDFIVPAKLAASAAEKAGETIEIALGVGKVFFRVSDNLEFIAAMIDGSYPDVDAIVPRVSELKVRFETEKMRQAVKRAVVFSENTIFRMDIDPEKSEIRVSTHSEELGDYDDTIPCELISRNGADVLAIAFNVNYLNSFLFGQTTDMGLNADNLPGRFTCESIPGWIGVLMPMHLGN